MKQQVQFRIINPPTERTTKAGGVYLLQEVVVAWLETDEEGKEHEQRLCCSLPASTQDQLKKRGIQVNDWAEVRIHFSTLHSYDDRVYNRVTLYLLDAVQQAPTPAVATTAGVSAADVPLGNDLLNFDL